MPVFGTRIPDNDPGLRSIRGVPTPQPSSPPVSPSPEPRAPLLQARVPDTRSFTPSTRMPVGQPRAGHGACRRAAGFTLMEILVVMVLVAMLFGIVGLSVSRSLSGAEIRNEAREVIAGLRHTRGQAIVKRNEQTFNVDAEKRTWQAAGREPKTLPEGLEVDMTTARSELTAENAGGIRFYPDGSSTGGNVKLVAGQRVWRINVAWLTGEVSLERDES